MCGRASTAARPVYELERAADRLVAIYPDAEHSFPKAARLEAYRFPGSHSGTSLLTTLPRSKMLDKKGNERSLRYRDRSRTDC